MNYAEMPLGGFAKGAPWRALRETAKRRIGMPDAATLPLRVPWEPRREIAHSLADAANATPAPFALRAVNRRTMTTQAIAMAIAMNPTR